MYRSIAHFAAWAISTAQDEPREGNSDVHSNGNRCEGNGVQNNGNGDALLTINSKDDAISIISCSSASSASNSSFLTQNSKDSTTPPLHLKCVLSATPYLKHKLHTQQPPFPTFDPENNMLRQRISHSGHVYDLPPIPAPPSSTQSPGGFDASVDTAEDVHPYIQPLTLPPSAIGVIKPEPVKRWMEGKLQWDTRYARQKRAVQRRRLREIAIDGEYKTRTDSAPSTERPPPSALFGRRYALEWSGRLRRMVAMGTKNTQSGGVDTPAEVGEGEKAPKKKSGLGWGLGLWMLMGSGHDKTVVSISHNAPFKLLRAFYSLQ